MSLDKPAKELIVDMVNASRQRVNPRAIPYTYNSVSFETPEYTPYDHEKNTDLVIKSSAGTTPLPVPRHIYYDRISLTTLANRMLGEGAVPEIEDEGYASVSQLLPAINTLLSIQLTTTEIDNDPISGGSYPKDVVVRVKSACLTYIGQLSVQLVDNVPLVNNSES